MYKRIKQQVLNNITFTNKAFNGLLCLSIGKRWDVTKMWNGKWKKQNRIFPIFHIPLPLHHFAFYDLETSVKDPSQVISNCR